MGQQTGIQWCDHTFNPWRGCQKVSPGCQHCYAEALAKRNPRVLGEWGPDGTRVIASEAMWRQPVRWNAEVPPGERRRVFCASLADVFEDRPELVAPRRRLFGLISVTPALVWLLLTKRPENVRRLWPAEVRPPGADRLNIWLGTSVEDPQRADARIPALLEVPAAVRFLSCEPLLGPVRLRATWTRGLFGGAAVVGLDWVIIGGESGPRARPCEVAWVRSLVAQCRETGIACFVKQLGACIPEWAGERGPFRLMDAKGGDMEEWPEDLRVRQFPEVRP